MYYRRANIPDATYFFTVNLADRKQTLLVDNIEALKASVHHVMTSQPFEILAVVVLPDQLHAIWTLPPDDADFATRWALIKAGFSRQLPKNERVSKSRESKGERGIWQRRYWEHVIRDDDDLVRHVDYIHYNPVKHGYAKRADGWPHSTLHKFIRDGIVREDWASEIDPIVGDWGERR
jgi:putative transposase